MFVSVTGTFWELAKGIHDKKLKSSHPNGGEDNDIGDDEDGCDNECGDDDFLDD